MPQTLPPHKEGVALVTTDTKLPAMDGWLIGGGEMAKLIKTKDWSGTPLGPIDTWPQSLRTVVSLVQASNSPISLAWGAGHVQIYNDGYWPICGAKHPGSMGQDYRECWASAFPVIGRVMPQHGPAIPPIWKTCACSSTVTDSSRRPGSHSRSARLPT